MNPALTIVLIVLIVTAVLSVLAMGLWLRSTLRHIDATERPDIHEQIAEITRSVDAVSDQMTEEITALRRQAAYYRGRTAR